MINPFSFIRRHTVSTGIYGYGSIPFYPGPLSNPPAGIAGAVAHQDIQTPHGTPFYAPYGGLTLVTHYIGNGYGWYLVLQTPDGSGHVVFMHMADMVLPQLPGENVSGGVLIGHTGGVPGTDPGVTLTDSSGAHLHCAFDFGYKQYIRRNYGRAAFGAHVPVWNYGEPLVRGGKAFHIGTPKPLNISPLQET